VITAREADGPLGRLRVERTWQELTIDGGEIVGWTTSQLASTLDGEPVIWPWSRELVDGYAADDPDFRAWMERTEP
jgi:hypothetical protein